MMMASRVPGHDTWSADSLNLSLCVRIRLDERRQISVWERARQYREVLSLMALNFSVIRVKALLSREPLESVGFSGEPLGQLVPLDYKDYDSLALGYAPAGS